VQRSFATRADDADFAGFECCGDDAAPWALETENYVRSSVLGHAEHVLALRDEEGALVAVSAFDRKRIEVPRAVDPLDLKGWQLQVVAVHRESQRNGLCAAVFANTFDAMRDLDPGRGVVQANVHKDNSPSIKACRNAGLFELMPLEPEGEYWILLGRVPGTTTELPLD
jgi:RimJ/RimL family protein N-acetyltransferase